MKIGTEIFNSLKGFGFLVELYQADGSGTIASPDLAVYVYAKDKTSQDSVMIRLPEEDEANEYSKVVVYKSEGMDDKLKKLLMTIKSIAISYGNTLTIREFGKNIEPKDLAYLPKAKQEMAMQANVNEGVGRWAIKEASDAQDREKKEYLVKYAYDVNGKTKHGQCKVFDTHDRASERVRAKIRSRYGSCAISSVKPSVKEDVANKGDINIGDEIHTKKMRMIGIVTDIIGDYVYFRVEDGRLMKAPLSNVAKGNGVNESGMPAGVNESFKNKYTVWISGGKSGNKVSRLIDADSEAGARKKAQKKYPYSKIHEIELAQGEDSSLFKEDVVPFPSDKTKPTAKLHKDVENKLVTEEPWYRYTYRETPNYIAASVNHGIVLQDKHTLKSVFFQGADEGEFLVTLIRYEDQIDEVFDSLASDYETVMEDVVPFPSHKVRPKTLANVSSTENPGSINYKLQRERPYKSHAPEEDSKLMKEKTRRNKKVEDDLKEDIVPLKSKNKLCQNCKGEGMLHLPSNPDRAGRRNVLRSENKVWTSCHGCKGKGYVTPEDIEDYYDSFKLSESAKYAKYGSTRSSYHVNLKEKKAKVIIRHSKKIIDETIKGVRSRNVKNLYVESLNGERRLIETKSLMCARAIANHVNCGGSLFDDTSNKIIALSEDIKKIRHIKKKYPVSEDQSNVKMHESLNYIIEGLADFMKELNTNKISTLSEALSLNEPNVAFSRAFYGEKLGEEFKEGIDSLARGSVLYTRTRKFMPK